MKNVTIKVRLVGAFVLILVLMLINVVFGVMAMRNVAGQAQFMEDAEIEALRESIRGVQNVTLDSLKKDGVVQEEGVQEVLNAVETDGSELIEALDAAEAAKKQANGYANTASYISFGILIISTLATVGISLSIVKEISKSIKQLSDAAGSIALGQVVNLSLEKPGNNEFGDLIDDYNKVIANIQYQARITEEVSNGNLTVTVNPASSGDLLGNSLKKLVEDNHRALSGINDAAYQVTIGASQVASASQSLAQGSTEQASAIEEINASIEDIAEKTKQNADQANTAADLVVKVIQDVKQGNEHMRDMMTSMQDINKASESISKIIKVIDDIAFQTNILALNAAVEAARAGEAGKGFAVVAEEVRSLAAKSAAAAAETAELIEDSIGKVGQGSKIADETAKALNVITDVVQKSEVLINNIAQSSNYQATAVAQIEQAITQVSQVVQTNSATSEECAAASEELSNQANKMREMLSIYRLGGKNTASAAGVSSYSSSQANANEQIISLGDSFGKY